jgi:hypothetical protein
VWASAVWACHLRHDSCELDVAVPPGEYALKLWQPLSGGDGCAEYDVVISVAPARESTDSQCDGVDALPASLPSQGGTLYWSKPRLLMGVTDSGEATARSSLQVTSFVY